MLLALMDEAYTGSTIGDGGGDSESEDSNTIDAVDAAFLDLLKDENDGLAVWSFLCLNLLLHLLEFLLLERLQMRKLLISTIKNTEIVLNVPLSNGMFFLIRLYIYLFL